MNPEDQQLEPAQQPDPTQPETPQPEETSPVLVEEATAAETPAETPEATPEPAAAPELESAPAKRIPYGQSAATTNMLAARAEHWHQENNPLLAIDALREWLTRSGLVLYSPRAGQLGPAPSFVEATLGKANPTPELADTEAARSLLARLISDGAAVPLNLLGTTGATGTDVPDFVVSAAVFSYIFTLRGNKAWKQLPVTSGPVKVSPLALAAYEILSAKVTLSAYDLTTALGKEVTEAAVLRALTELWSQLRVLPVPQQDGSTTMWELATGRFTKQIKAGANAGQPSALSALISLYLGQALIATEDEIESFLSPLAPRSRVRDVVHALMSARQLETLVIDGKTLLHVAGEAPAFAGIPAEPAAEKPAFESTGDGSRISKFAAKPGSKIGTGLRSKPAFGKKPYGAPDRERRPFAGGGGARPSFNKPWNEDRKPREASEGGEARRPYTPRPAGDRPYTPRPSGDRPFTPRPRFEGRSEGFSGARPTRPFTPRTDGDGPRKTFSKPGTFGRKREGFGGKPAGPTYGGSNSQPRGTDDARPPRRDFGGDSRPPRRDFGGSSDRPSGGGGFKRPGSFSPRPPSGDRPSYGSSGGSRPPFNQPSFGPKPSFGGSEQSGSGGGEAPRKVFRKFDAPRDKKPFGAKPFGAKPFGDRKPFTPGSSARPPRSFDGPRSFDKPRPSFGDRPERPSFDRPRPAFGAKPFGGKPAGGGFAGKKPFGSRPAGGGFSGGRPGAGRPGGGGGFSGGGSRPPFRKPGGSGFTPSPRRRPEDAE